MKNRFPIVICVTLLMAQPLLADTILSETYTASELFTMATFPSRSPSLTMGNTRLEFPAGAAWGEVLAVLPLLSANTLSTLEPATVMLTLDTALLTLDNDLAVGITDGQDFVSVMRTDLANAHSYFVEAPFSTPTMPSAAFTPSAILGAGVEVFTMTFTLSTTSSVTATIGSGTDSRIFTRAINRENPLNLVFLANDTSEQYGIYSATVTIDQVPEPACTSLLLLGVSTLLLRRNRTMARLRI